LIPDTLANSEMRIVLCLLIAATVAFEQSATLPRAPGAAIVTVSEPGRSHEPSIAVDPNDQSHLVVAWQNQAHIAYSTDGGHTFTTAEGTAPTDWRVSGDVSVTYDNKGHAFLCYLAFDRTGPTSGYWARKAGRNGIFVRRSPDGGKTWEKEPAALKSFPTGQEPDRQWEDMPRIFADNNSASPFAGNLYAGWIEWQMEQSIMLFSRSTDSGKTWSAPIRISTKAGLPRDGVGGLVGLVGAAGSDGSLYVVWNDGKEIVMAISRDGGKSFAPSRSIIETGPPVYPSGLGHPQVGVDCRNGRVGGKVFVSWSDYRNGDVDVFVASSADRGRTWSKPVRVNSDELHDGIDQFFQWMAVDPVTGVVYVQFYDRREDPENRKTRMILARSVDGGVSFTNYAWGDAQFEGRPQGDYTWLTALNNRVYGVWSEPASPAANPTPAGGRAGRGGAASGPSVVRVGLAEFQ
jgi:hypothetical protein